MEPWDPWEMFKFSQLESDFMFVSHLNRGRWPLLNNDYDPGTELRFFLSFTKTIQGGIIIPTANEIKRESEQTKDTQLNFDSAVKLHL